MVFKTLYRFTPKSIQLPIALVSSRQAEAMLILFEFAVQWKNPPKRHINSNSVKYFRRSRRHRRPMSVTTGRNNENKYFKTKAWQWSFSRTVLKKQQKSTFIYEHSSLTGLSQKRPCYESTTQPCLDLKSHLIWVKSSHPIPPGRRLLQTWWRRFQTWSKQEHPLLLQKKVMYFYTSPHIRIENVLSFCQFEVKKDLFWVLCFQFKITFLTFTS